jgi:hypothetical protein
VSLFLGMHFSTLERLLFSQLHVDQCERTFWTQKWPKTVESCPKWSPTTYIDMNFFVRHIFWKFWIFWTNSGQVFSNKKLRSCNPKEYRPNAKISLNLVTLIWIARKQGLDSARGWVQGIHGCKHLRKKKCWFMPICTSPQFFESFTSITYLQATSLKSVLLSITESMCFNIKICTKICKSLILPVIIKQIN